MSFLRRIFGSSKPTPSQETQSKDNAKREGRNVATDPVLFANWVNEYIILGLSFDDDFSLAPNEEQCKRLNISNKERTLCANEYVLLRTLGACLFVRKYLDERYYLTFRETLLPPVIERMNRNAPYNHYDNPSDALDQYLEELKSDSHVGFSMTYLNRVYPDSPNSMSLFLNSIPVTIAFEYAMDCLKQVRNGYSVLSTGFEYEALEKIEDILKEQEKQKNENSTQ